MSTNSQQRTRSFPQIDGVRSEINERVVYVQKMLQLSGADIARGSGLTRSYISRVTSGKVNVGVELLLYLASKHLVSTDWLLLGEGSILRTNHIQVESPLLRTQVEELQNEMQSLREEVHTYSKAKKSKS